MDDEDEATTCMLDSVELLESDDKSDSSGSRRQSLKSPHTLLKESLNSELSIHSMNDDTAEHLRRLLEEATHSLSSRDIVIKMLQEQLKKIEDLYKNSLDHTQDLRYKYCSTAQDLGNLKKICQKYEEEIEKLSKNPCERPDHDVNEIERLQHEAENWKKQYERTLRRIKTMEADTAALRNLLPKGELQSSKAQNSKLEKNRRSEDTQIIQQQYKNMENALLQQNEKLEEFVLKLQTDLEQSKDRQKELEKKLNVTQGDLIEITIEARKLRQTSQTMRDSSLEKLWQENRTLKEEVIQLKSESGFGKSINESKVISLQEKNYCLESDNERLKEELCRLEIIKGENTLLNEKMLAIQKELKKQNDCIDKPCLEAQTQVVDNTFAYRKENVRLRDQINQLKDELENLCPSTSKDCSCGSKELHEVNEDLCRENVELREKIVQIESSEEQIDLENFNLRKDLKKKNEELQMLKKEFYCNVDAKNSTITELHARIEALKCECESTAISKAEADEELRIKQLREKDGIIEVERYRDEVAELKNNLNNTFLQKEQIETELCLLKKSTENNNGMFKNCECKMKDLRSEYEQQTINLEKIRRENESLFTKMETNNETIKKYKDELSAKVAENKQLLEKEQKLQCSFSDFRRNCEFNNSGHKLEMEKNLTAMEKLTAQYNKLKGDMQTYVENLQRAEKEIVYLQSILKGKECELKCLKSNLEKIELDLERVKVDENNKKLTVDKELNKVERYCAELQEKLEHSIFEHDRSITEQEEELKFLRQEILSLQNDIQAKKGIIKRQRDSLKDVIAKNKEFERENQDLLKKLQDLTDEMKAMEEKFHVDLLESSELKETITKLSEDNAELRKSLEKLICNLEDKLSEVTPNSDEPQKISSSSRAAIEILESLKIVSNSATTHFAVKLPTQVDEENKTATTTVEVTALSVPQCTKPKQNLDINEAQTKAQLSDIEETQKTDTTGKLENTLYSEIDELQFKRKYFLQRVESIEEKLKNTTGTSNKLTPCISKSLTDITKKCNCAENQNTCICGEDNIQIIYKNNEALQDENICNQSLLNGPNKRLVVEYFELIGAKQRWRKNITTIQQLRKELHGTKRKISNEKEYKTHNKKTNNYKYDHLAKQVKELKTQLRDTAEMEKEIDLLQKQLNGQYSQICAYKPNDLKQHFEKYKETYGLEDQQNLKNELLSTQIVLEAKSEKEENLERIYAKLLEQVKKNEEFQKKQAETPVLPSTHIIPVPVPQQCACSCSDPYYLYQAGLHSSIQQARNKHDSNSSDTDEDLKCLYLLR